MCSALPCSRRSIGGMHIKLRSCWKMKTRILFHSLTIFLGGANGRSTSNGCNIDENSWRHLAAVASMNHVTTCAHLAFSSHHEGHEEHEDAHSLPNQKNESGSGLCP